VRQIYSAADVDFGQVDVDAFGNWAGGVPPGQTLEVGSVLLNYFPSGGGTLGRCDIAGRDAKGATQWRLDVVYVRPKETTYLAFPVPLLLESGGTVMLGFTDEGPGTIHVTIHGRLT
jgi:hypothetical protein